MADTIRKVDYFSIQTPNKPGEGLRYLGGLEEHGVNLLAFTGFPSGRRAQIDFVPEDTSRLRAAAKKMKVPLGARKVAFLLQGEDRAGALAATLEKLATAKINVTAMDAVTGGEGRFGAIFWVKPKDVARAAKLLGAR
jgi:prephenate dehydratase